LRARPEDIGILARYFLRDQPSAFDIRAYRALFLHRWPGNVRELEKTLRTAKVLSEGLGRVAFGDLGTDAQRASGGDEEARDPVEFPTVRLTSSGTHVQPPVTFRTRLESKPTPEMLTILLERHRGNVGHVAREIGRQRTLVWRWLRIAGIDASRYRDEGAERRDPHL
jgi:transcriptional regulator of acetoin/glycerol metabolism